MSSGITFYDYREAREYQSRLLEEGQNSTLSSLHGKYVVTPKGKDKAIKYHDIPQEWKDKHGTGAYHYTDKEGEHHVMLEKGNVKARLLLHEIGHAELGHEYSGGRTTGEIIEREIDAETYSMEKMGKKPDYRVGLYAVRKLAWDTDIGARSIVNEVARRLEDRGISVTKENKAWLLEHAWNPRTEEDRALMGEIKEEF